MFHVCVQKFDGMDENFLSGELNRALSNNYPILVSCCLIDSSGNWKILRPCLVSHLKIFRPSHRIFGHMHETLNIDKKNKLITQFG